MDAASEVNRKRPRAGDPVPEDPRLARLHRRILACHSCADAGLLDHPAPVVPAPIKASVVLVGQAPGRVEEAVGRPFSGRAGRQLFRWLEQAGLGEEEEARQAVYLSSITKCFPGPAPSGTGDRRPSPAEVELCRGHLESQLRLLRPWLILGVGQMAVDRLLGPLPMHLAVGRIFGPGGLELSLEDAIRSSQRPLLLPLPHPSGASRWLNLAEHRVLLARALQTLAALLRAGGEV
ncbi:MAG TPA: uracil-DNA glycosylase family protein [Candidatus Dormibacteraeota bacterium]|nr:uracil-DNA glycosylase family protein [Candidatus Dormibacteraeota bacterium]